MSFTRVRTLKAPLLLLLILLLTSACDELSDADMTATADAAIQEGIVLTTTAQNLLSTQEAQVNLALTTAAESVALTVDAQNATPELSVEESVALTVDAQNIPPTLSVEESVALTVAAQSVSSDDPDVADPAAAAGTPVQADPDVASGTPQLRVLLSANVRKGPSTSYDVITALAKDSVMTIVAKNQNGSWLLIELPDGSQGWIAASVSEYVVEADKDKVQVAATIPPSPTPTATATATGTPTETPTTNATGTATEATEATATPTLTPTTEGVSFDLTNNSGYDICFVFINNGNNELPNDVLANGETKTFTYTGGGSYDVYVEECTPSAPPPWYWDFYNNTGYNSWVLTDFNRSNPVGIEIYNNSGVDVCYVLLNPSGEPYGPNELGSNVLANGQTMSFSYVRNVQYDVYAQECLNGTDWYWEYLNNSDDIYIELTAGNRTGP